MGVIGGLRRRVFDRIGTRIALVLAIALLPLAIVSALRTTTISNQAQARSESALAGETLRAISREITVIETTRGAAFALASAVPAVLDDPETCRQVMRRVVSESDFSFAGFFSPDHVAYCASVDREVAFPNVDEFDEQLADGRARVRINRDAPVSQTSIIYATETVYDADGTAIGLVAVSMPHSAIGMTEGETPFAIWSGIAPDVAFMTFNAQGEVLTATGVEIEDAALVLPEYMTREDLLKRRIPFTAPSVDDQERTYAVVPILGGQLFAVGTWPEHDVVASTVFYRFPALFPALMWIASLVAAYLAAELLVTRDVQRLRRSIRNFSDTRRGVEVADFDFATVELRDMAASYAEMTDIILREEAELEDSVRQKDVLLREVHHRVKNNLQLIASIMNMQMRKSRSEEARSLMRGLHDRVMSLATVHKGLYQTSGLADVRADELLSDILTQITHLGADGAIEVEQEYDELRLTPEQAVPLTLAVTEALTNAVKYAKGKDGAKPSMKLRLIADEDRNVTVIISNTVLSESERAPAGNPGLGTQLLTAFSQQLHGTLDKAYDGDWFVVTLKFEADPLGQQSATANVF